MKLYYPFTEYAGFADIIDPADTGVLGFSLLSLEPGQSCTLHTGGHETGLVILGGRADVTVAGETFASLGLRDSVFSGRATTVYIPVDSEYRITAIEKCEAALCRVRAENKYAPFVVEPSAVTVHRRGERIWQREVHELIADNGSGRVDRIILGETFGVPGNWSGFPPHKHDCDRPGHETAMQEIYHFRLEPVQLFGVQVIYRDGDGPDEAFLIRNGDTVYIPGGYHPVAAPPGVRLYYLWFLGGKGNRTLLPHDDPGFKNLEW